MSVIESVVVGLFCLFIVFLVLAVLYALVILLSVALKSLAGRQAVSRGKLFEAESVEEEAPGQQSTNGKLELINVDDKTAATIMAIVSHESGIPLDELNFKHIKAMDK